MNAHSSASGQRQRPADPRRTRNRRRPCARASPARLRRLSRGDVERRIVRSIQAIDRGEHAPATPPAPARTTSRSWRTAAAESRRTATARRSAIRWPSRRARSHEKSDALATGCSVIWRTIAPSDDDGPGQQQADRHPGATRRRPRPATRSCARVSATAAKYTRMVSEQRPHAQRKPQPSQSGRRRQEAAPSKMRRDERPDLRPDRDGARSNCRRDTGAGNRNSRLGLRKLEQPRLASAAPTPAARRTRTNSPASDVPDGLPRRRAGRSARARRRRVRPRASAPPARRSRSTDTRRRRRRRSDTAARAAAAAGRGSRFSRVQAVM